MVRVVVIFAGGVLAGCGSLVQAHGTTDGDGSSGSEGSEDAAATVVDDAGPGDDGMPSTEPTPDLDSTGGGVVADTSGGGDPPSDSSGSGSDASSSTAADGGASTCGDGRTEAAEDCDDANASEIDGCTSACELGPVGLTFGNASTTEENGGNGSQITPFSDDCPAGQVLTGMTGRLTSQGLGSAVVLGRIQGECSSLSLFDADPTAIDSAPGVSLIEHGGYQEGGDWALECPTGSVVTAFEGDAGAIIDSMSIRCRPLQVDGDGNAQVLELGMPESDGPVGGNGGDPFGPVACPGGEIAAGLAGDTNSYVIRLALRCRSIALDYPRP